MGVLIKHSRDWGVRLSLLEFVSYRGDCSFLDMSLKKIFFSSALLLDFPKPTVSWWPCMPFSEWKSPGRIFLRIVRWLGIEDNFGQREKSECWITWSYLLAVFNMFLPKYFFPTSKLFYLMSSAWSECAELLIFSTHLLPVTSLSCLFVFCLSCDPNPLKDVTGWCCSSQLFSCWVKDICV